VQFGLIAVKKHRTLRKENGFTDAAGVALLEALPINKTLRVILFASDPVYTKAYLGAQAYEAFCAMLRVNAGIKLILPDALFDATVGDERNIDHLNQMRIEQRLNEVGRGRLLAWSLSLRCLFRHCFADHNI
jgi:hypothetical protein